MKTIFRKKFANAHKKHSFTHSRLFERYEFLNLLFKLESQKMIIFVLIELGKGKHFGAGVSAQKYLSISSTTTVSWVQIPLPCINQNQYTKNKDQSFKTCSQDRGFESGTCQQKSPKVITKDCELLHMISE